MSRVIDFDKPLSDEDKRWLHERSLDWRIEENERKFGQSDTHAEGTPINMKAVLADAGVEVPEAPATPIYVGEQGPGTEGFRDHPLTGVVVASDEDEDAEEADFDVKSLTVEELRDNLREFGESTSGNKAELQKRLTKVLGTQE